MKTTQTLDYSEASKIIELIVDKALQMQKAAVIAVPISRRTIAFARMDGAPISSIRIAANKAWTAARERKPTKDIGEKVRHPEKGHDIAYYGDPKFVGWGGGLPVLKDGQVVGAVAVSGLSSTEDIAWPAWAWSGCWVRMNPPGIGADCRPAADPDRRGVRAADRYGERIVMAHRVGCSAVLLAVSTVVPGPVGSACCWSSRGRPRHRGQRGQRTDGDGLVSRHERGLAMGTGRLRSRSVSRSPL